MQAEEFERRGVHAISIFRIDVLRSNIRNSDTRKDKTAVAITWFPKFRIRRVSAREIEN